MITTPPQKIMLTPTRNQVWSTTTNYIFKNTSLLTMALTCRNAALSVSFSASMQNCKSAVVCCNRAVHVTTCSLSALTRISLSCLMHSSSWARLLRIASIRASHWAVTTASNSSQFSWNGTRIWQVIRGTFRKFQLFGLTVCSNCNVNYCFL